jgi:hypothetical protein
MPTHQQSYTTSFTVDRTAKDAFDAINNVAGWWSQEVVGPTDRVGAEFQYHYQDVHRCTVRVTELVPGRRVAWLVVDNYFNFVEDQAEWKDTEIVFEIADTDTGAEVRFTHVGLAPQLECYDVCSNAWGGYVDGSLRNLILTGQGQPNPKEDGDAAAHQETANVHRATRSPVAAGSGAPEEMR